ncbi:unnamed protein product [Cylicocyclus nassatus]|uniref:Uncharacterized protein n=1 Tax=Cylicocyclus nassatus TaxID=53992 RepID=A0AA36H787_CYLNA|nr:unnamed protein product [Cylicocyclus nassatus]
MLPDLENCDCDEEREAERQNSTRSCPSSFPATVTRRAQFPRRSLKELRIDVGKNLEPLVHRARLHGLERIAEDPVSPAIADEKPTAPPRTMRARAKVGVATVDTRATSPAASDPPPSERSVAERIEETLNAHYYTIAYTLVIVAYLVGFAEYLYFRLVSILIPEHTYYHPSCQEKQDRRVGKDGFHYSVSIGAFIAIALFQLIIVKMKHDLAAHIRKTISQSMYRTFLCYGICSFINCGIIFYMVAIQDALDETGTVLLYVFDGVVILYFLAFPLTTVIYHPHVHCFQSHPGRAARLPSFIINGIRSQTSTLESNLSQEAAQPSAVAFSPQEIEEEHNANPAVAPSEPIEQPLGHVILRQSSPTSTAV